MRKIYKYLIKLLEKIFVAQNYVKMLLSENYALWRKRKIIRTVQWNKKQVNDFNNYWRENYKKIKNNGHKLFQAFNGVYHKDYMPDFLYATKIESQLNPYFYSKIYSDKGLLDILYKNKSNALLPKTLLLNANGIFYNENREVIDNEEVTKIIESLSDIVVKPIIDGNSGKGVIVAKLDKNGVDRDSDFNVKSLLKEKNFIVQEVIKQSKTLDTIYPHSINTFRVITYISNQKIHVAPLSLRIGKGGKKIDNIHAGGLAVGVNDKDETLLKYAYQLGYSDQLNKFTFHPDTNTYFEGYKIPGIKSIVVAAQRLHGFTPHIGIISWDFTLNTDDNPVLIEANFIGQSVWFSQIVNAKPIFEENTKNILKKIK